MTETKQIEYFKGYKYQLATTATFETNFRPPEDIHWKRLHLTRDGIFTIDEGYAWDGPSGPVVDRESNMRASLVHDGLYQLMRMNELDHNDWKKADLEYVKRLLDDGTMGIVADIHLAGLDLVGGSCAHPSARKEIHKAPLPEASKPFIGRERE